MEFNVYSSLDSHDRNLWRSAWELLPTDRRDIYFRPEYLHAFEAEGRGTAHCAVARKNGRVWLYPFLKLSVPSEFIRTHSYFDIQTPYGYGGPVVNVSGEDTEFLAEVSTQWTSFCKQEHIVAELTRFHPLLDNHRWVPSDMQVDLNRQTIPMWLDRYPNMVRNDPYFRRHRQMLNKAEREGYTFEHIPTSGQLPWFTSMYTETQDRLGAGETTRFTEKYFNSLAQGLGDKAWLGIVRKSTEIMAAVMVIEGTSFAHSHLMGTHPFGGRGGSTNLVYHGIAVEAARRGLRVLHMGGGRTASDDDSLLHFKISLSPDRAAFRLGRRCHNAAVYQRLCAEWESRNGPYPEGYFMPYYLKPSGIPTSKDETSSVQCESMGTDR